MFSDTRFAVAFDWTSISAQSNPEQAYYRLLGEMLHRRATPSDLGGIREFLGRARLTDDVWLSLGEGLFHTTGGNSAGYRMWCAWSRSVVGKAFDEARQLEAWRQFEAGTSEGLEHNSEPATVSLDEFDEDEATRTRVVGADTGRAGVAQNAANAVALIPSGPHTIRLFGEVFERVDEFALLKLLRGGVFLGLDVLFGARWLNVLDHPGFVPLIECLRDEAFAELATRERSRAEVTQPGTF